MQKYYLLHDDYVYNDLDTAIDYALDGDEIDSTVAGIVSLNPATGTFVMFNGQGLQDMVADRIRENAEQKAYNNEISSSKVGGTL